MSFTPSSPSSPLGLTGATAATRYVGATTSGAPASGTFAVGDMAVAQNGHIFVCTVAGSPGTWVDVGAGGNLVTSVFGRTGAVAAAANDYTFAQIAASANAVAVSNLAAGLAGQVLGGTAPGYDYPPGYELGYNQVTGNTSITATTQATANTVIAGSSYTFQNVKYYFHFFCANVAPGTTQIITTLYKDGTAYRDISLTKTSNECVYAVTDDTPTAAAHTYSLRAYVDGGTGNIAPSGFAPAYLRITKA